MTCPEGEDQYDIMFKCGLKVINEKNSIKAWKPQMPRILKDLKVIFLTAVEPSVAACKFLVWFVRTWLHLKDLLNLALAASTNMPRY